MANLVEQAARYANHPWQVDGPLLDAQPFPGSFADCHGQDDCATDLADRLYSALPAKAAVMANVLPSSTTSRCMGSHSHRS